jgi:hypothetical protein
MHIDREAEAGEGRARSDRPAGAVSGSHGQSLTARTTSRPTQQSRQASHSDPACLLFWRRPGGLCDEIASVGLIHEYAQAA